MNGVVPDGSGWSGRSGGEHDACQGLREEAAVALLTRTPIPPQVQAHLDLCPPCADELSELAALVPLLEGAREDVLDPVAPSDLMLPRLLAEADRERRRRRRLLAVGVAAAVVVVAAAAATGVLIGRGSGPVQVAGGRPSTSASSGAVGAGSAPSVTVPVTAAGASTVSAASGGPTGSAGSGTGSIYSSGEGEDPVTGAEADVDIRAASYGSTVLVRVKAVPPGTRCRLVVVDRRGTTVEAGSWTVPAAGYADYELFTETVMTPATDVAAVRLVDDRTKKVILHVDLVKV